MQLPLVNDVHLKLSERFVHVQNLCILTAVYDTFVRFRPYFPMRECPFTLFSTSPLNVTIKPDTSCRHVRNPRVLILEQTVLLCNFSMLDFRLPWYFVVYYFLQYTLRIIIIILLFILFQQNNILFYTRCI